MNTIAQDDKQKTWCRRSKKKNRHPDDTLPHFKHEWRCHERDAINLFEAFVMEPRNSAVRQRHISALCVILANITAAGMNLQLDNFSRLRVESCGYSRQAFLNVLNHLEKVALIHRKVEEGDFTQSVITYSTRILMYKPVWVYYQPAGTILINDKETGVRKMGKINNAERKELKEGVQKYWDFVLENEIKLNLTKTTFDLFNDYEVEVKQKKPLAVPDERKVLPHISFNDQELTLGGRFYGAFWINCKKEFRKLITINGELTSDIDGRAMHTQLLYKLKGMSMPLGNPYLYEGELREVTKMLMLLMLNTRQKETIIEGRKKVIKTYLKDWKRRAFLHRIGVQGQLEKYIEELETYHSKILDELYQPNWGRLQKTEAAVMLKIMLRGVAEDVLVLPVHDGCLCAQKNKKTVLGYFESEGIIAEEKVKHLNPLPITETMDALRAYRHRERVAA